MYHQPIHIKDVCLSFPHKDCFLNFSAIIHSGDRIAVIGRNGSGKSTLLNILSRTVEPSSGGITYPENIVIDYVPQIINANDYLSGGQRTQKAICDSINNNPAVLLLDEPTNHLDSNNRKSLMRLLNTYQGTLIVATHDVDFISNMINTLWHIDESKIHIFSGKYTDYIREKGIKRSSIEQELNQLNRQRKDVHHSLMKEQKRAKGSSLKGKKSISERKWPTIVSNAKASRAGETSGKKASALSGQRDDLLEKLSDVRLPEIIVPTFSIKAADIKDGNIICISDGEVGYQGQIPLLKNIHLAIQSCDRLAIVGDNGSGKSTVMRAILDDPSVVKSGKWHIPKTSDIGYLDQHYATLDSDKTVFNMIEENVLNWSHAEIRRHLNDFLFRKNEEVNAHVKTLSGGEKARLSLAMIAANTPKLLLLDEVTNNLDIETKEHVIHVLKGYPGAIIVISHDPYFLQEIGITSTYKVQN